MSVYLNVYLVERGTKEKKYLKSYVDSSVVYSIFDEAVNPPFSDDEEPAFKELTEVDIKQVRNILAERYKDSEVTRKNNEKVYEESKKIFIEVLINKENADLCTLKEEIDKFAWDRIFETRDDDDWENELNYANGELTFYETLYDDFIYSDSSPFCAIAVNEG